MSEIRNALMSMPVGAASRLDPAIPLAAGQGNSMLGGNPMGMFQGFAQIQNMLNQNRMFQQTFAAQNAAGEIMATSPDMATALQRMQGSGMGAFMIPTMNAVREYQKTTAELAGAYQTQSNSGMEAYSKGLAAVYANPGNAEELWNEAAVRGMANLSPEAKAGAAPYIKAGQQAIFDNLPADPAARSQMIQQRVLGQMAGAGIGPDTLYGLTGRMKPTFETAVGLQGQPIPFVAGGSPFGGGPGAPAGAGGGNAMMGGGGAAGGGVPMSPLGFTGPTTYGASRYKQISDAADTLDSTVRQGQNTMEVIQEARNALQSFKPGGLASTYQQVAQFAQGLGASPALVDRIGNGDLGASQEFNKLMLQAVIPQIRQGLEGTAGRLAVQEFNAYLERNPNIETDPRTINQMFNWWEKIQNINTARQQFRDRYMAAGGDPLNWPTAENQMMKEKGYTVQWAPGVGPMSSKVPGATPPTPQPTQTNQLTRPPLSSFFGR